MHTEINNTSEPALEWFDEETVKSFLIHYLRDKKYIIVNDSSKGAQEQEGPIVAISRSGQKELIEVKGYPSTQFLKNIQKESLRKTDTRQQARYWFSEALLTSFINFGRHSWSGKVTLALGLPDTERYQQIIKNVQSYFTANNLNLKVYLIAEEGTVEEVNLNENRP